MLHTYLYGLNRLGYERNESSYLYLHDALGSVRQMVKVNGANVGLTLSQSYDPYGSVIYTHGGETTYGYTGEQQDNSGQVYLRARIYQPTTGTFLSRDTWEGDANLPMSYNRWLYTNGNPVNYTDPSGKCADGVTTAGCIAAAMVVGGVSGGLIGGFSSVVYAKYIYGLALEGRCDECTRNFLIQYTEDKFISDVGAGGAAIGAIYGATAGLGPEIAYGAAASLGADAAMLANIGIIGLGLAGVDDAVKRLQRNPNDDCAKIDLGLSIAAMAGSLGAGLSGYKVQSPAGNSSAYTAERFAGKYQNHQNGAIAEWHGYYEAVNSKKHVGIQSPGAVTSNGPDFITFDPRSNQIYVWDAKYSSGGNFPSNVRGFVSESWMARLQYAITKLNDPALQKVVQKAFDNGDIYWEIYKWPQ